MLPCGFGQSVTATIGYVNNPTPHINTTSIFTAPQDTYNPYINHNTMLYYNSCQPPSITTHPPPNNDVDWFYMDGDMKWKLFDWRRCNLLENMLHYCHQGEFQIVFRDIPYIVDYEHMLMYHENNYYKLRRESALVSRPVRPGFGKWSYYNGQTWIQYDKIIQQQLEELLPKQEPLIIMIAHNKQYIFDIDQNVQIEPVDDKGLNKRKIITRQWMTTQQLQDGGRSRKQQETSYIKERKQLEDYMKMNSNMNKKKQKHNNNNNNNNNKKSVISELGITIKEDTSTLFKMIELPKSPMQSKMDPKQMEEWNKLIEQMKQEDQMNA